MWCHSRTTPSSVPVSSMGSSSSLTSVSADSRDPGALRFRKKLRFEPSVRSHTLCARMRGRGAAYQSEFFFLGGGGASRGAARRRRAAATSSASTPCGASQRRNATHVRNAVTVVADHQARLKGEEAHMRDYLGFIVEDMNLLVKASVFCVTKRSGRQHN